MWFFRSPDIVFGEGALDYLLEIQGHRALIVTDRIILSLGLVDEVKHRLDAVGIESSVFAEVEPNPSLETVQRGAQAALEYGPDWIIGLGGGSAIDAAKGIFVLYERPDLPVDGIAPVGSLGLRQKARLIAIPTTSGTGAETTWAIVLTDTQEHRKINLGHSENIPDLAIVDPELVLRLPRQITGDTGMDALTHAIEGYTSQWHNDFADGLCLKAAQLVLDYLPAAVEQGAGDPEAREKMHNAATIAGLGFGNSMAALAHGLGHSLGSVCGVPHGQAVGLFLPYTIEYTARGDAPTRYAEIARFLGLPASDEAEGAASLAAAIRDLARRIGQPTTLREAGLSSEQFEVCLPKLVGNANSDSATLIGLRIPDETEIEHVCRYALEGKSIDF
jgi:alcohol dehydrogenase class IV